MPLTGDNMNTTKKSLKDRIWDYLIKNEEYIVPGILRIGGSSYYPANNRRRSSLYFYNSIVLKVLSD